MPVWHQETCVVYRHPWVIELARFIWDHAQDITCKLHVAVQLQTQKRMIGRTEESTDTYDY